MFLIQIGSKFILGVWIQTLRFKLGPQIAKNLRSPGICDLRNLFRMVHLRLDEKENLGRWIKYTGCVESVSI